MLIKIKKKIGVIDCFAIDFNRWIYSSFFFVVTISEKNLEKQKMDGVCMLIERE